MTHRFGPTPAMTPPGAKLFVAALVVGLTLCFRVALADIPPPAERPPHGPEDTAMDPEGGITVTPWLTLSGQIELEWGRERLTPWEQGKRESTTETSSTYKLGVRIHPPGNAWVELILEYESDTGQLRADEAFVAYESGPWELSAGKFYTPFGRYWSEFITGPILEFGETRASGIEFAYAPPALVKPSVMVYRGDADRYNAQRHGLDWAFALEVDASEALTLGVSYQSDLSDSDERLGTDHDDRYVRKVDAAAAFLRWERDPVDVTVETLAALKAFEGMESDRDKPLAWNIELTHPLPYTPARMSWRLEGSEELEDQPELQAGVALNWPVTEHIGIELEYLRGRFERGLAGDDELPLRYIDTYGAKLTIEF